MLRPAIAVGLLAVAVTRAGAQSPPPARATLCFEERPPGACGATFMMVPAVHAILGSSGDAEYPAPGGGTQMDRVTHFRPFQYTVAVALLRDVGDRDALGGFVQAGLANKQQIRVALGARYRWRLRDSLAVDLSPGILQMQMPGENFERTADYQPRIGGTVDVDLHIRHWAILSTRLDVIPTDRSGTAVGLGAGLKADGFAGGRVMGLLAATALVLVAFAVAYMDALD